MTNGDGMGPVASNRYTIQDYMQSSGAQPGNFRAYRAR